MQHLRGEACLLLIVQDHIDGLAVDLHRLLALQAAWLALLAESPHRPQHAVSQPLLKPRSRVLPGLLPFGHLCYSCKQATNQGSAVHGHHQTSEYAAFTDASCCNKPGVVLQSRCAFRGMQHD